MMWPELLLDFWAYKVIRTEKRAEASGWWWFFGRVSFLFVIWLIGFVIYLADGLMFSYLSDFRTYAILFGFSPIVFIGTNGLRGYLDWFFPLVRPVLSSSVPQFETFRNRVTRFVTSFLGVLGLSLVLVFFLTDVLEELRQVFIKGITASMGWNIAFPFFVWLVIATGVWISLSTWLTVFLMSRQPLKMKSFRETSKTFQRISRWVLYCSLGYFIGVAITIFFPPAGIPSLSSHIYIAAASYLLFSLIGALGCIVPFYNIHRVFVRLKKQELQEISEQSKRLVGELDQLLTKCTSKECKDDATVMSARLLSLQVREKSVRELDEWPVSIGFFSAVASFVAIPLLMGFIIELITRVFFR